MIANPLVQCLPHLARPCQPGGRQCGGSPHEEVCPRPGRTDPFIVLADADVPDTAREAATGRFANEEQACTSSKRILVEDAVLGPNSRPSSWSRCSSGSWATRRAVRPSLDRWRLTAPRADLVARWTTRSPRAPRSTSVARSPTAAWCLRPGHCALGRGPDDARLPRGAVRPGGGALPGRLGCGGGRDRQRLAVRPRCPAVFGRDEATAQEVADQLEVGWWGSTPPSRAPLTCRSEALGILESAAALGRFGLEEFADKEALPAHSRGLAVVGPLRFLVGVGSGRVGRGQARTSTPTTQPIREGQ